MHVCFVLADIIVLVELIKCRALLGSTLLKNSLRARYAQQVHMDPRKDYLHRHVLDSVLMDTHAPLDRLIHMEVHLQVVLERVARLALLAIYVTEQIKEDVPLVHMQI